MAAVSAKVEPNPVYSNLGTAGDQQETKNRKTKNTKYVHVFGNMTKFSRTKITNITHACKEELGEGMPHSYGLVETHILPKDWPRNKKNHRAFWVSVQGGRRGSLPLVQV